MRTGRGPWPAALLAAFALAAWPAPAAGQALSQADMVVYQDAVNAFNSGDWARAIELLQEVISRSPESSESTGRGTQVEAYIPYYYLALSYAGIGDCDTAMEVRRQVGLQFLTSEQERRLRNLRRECNPPPLEQPSWQPEPRDPTRTAAGQEPDEATTNPQVSAPEGAPAQQPVPLATPETGGGETPPTETDDRPESERPDDPVEETRPEADSPGPAEPEPAERPDPTPERTRGADDRTSSAPSAPAPTPAVSAAQRADAVELFLSGDYERFVSSLCGAGAAADGCTGLATLTGPTGERYRALVAAALFFLGDTEAARAQLEDVPAPALDALSGWLPRRFLQFARGTDGSRG